MVEATLLLWFSVVLIPPLPAAPEAPSAGSPEPELQATQTKSETIGSHAARSLFAIADSPARTR
jgi:hypothetical protein